MGASHAALGKGECAMPDNAILIAAQVKSFDSRDSNRDLHMIQVTQEQNFRSSVCVSTWTEADSFVFDHRLRRRHRVCGPDRAPSASCFFNKRSREISIALREPFHPHYRTSKLVGPRSSQFPSKNEMPVKVDITWHLL
jgi:hypothetical protein